MQVEQGEIGLTAGWGGPAFIRISRISAANVFPDRVLTLCPLGEAGDGEAFLPPGLSWLNRELATGLFGIADARPRARR